MSVLKKNLAANYAGSLWTGLMGMVFVPLYVRFMGIEAYGLVGVFATLLALFGLLDMGLSNTLNREMARLSVRKDVAQEMRDLVRSLEIPYLGMALLIGAGVVILSPLIAHHWVNAAALAPDTVRRAIIFMGLATAFQWPLSFYSGGLMGLQRQVLLNGINTIAATFRGLGAVLILWLVSPTVDAFFLWQIVVSAVHTAVVQLFLWQSLPRSAERPRFRRDLLSSVWRFAAGVTGITVLSSILMQMDKIILSRMLTLEAFGYYALANVVAMSLFRLISPVVAACSPRMTNLISLGAFDDLARLYHKSAQLVSLLILPAGIIVVFYAKEILLLWTRDPQIAEHTYTLVRVLLVGTVLNGLVCIPYALQLSYGWTKLTFLYALVGVLVLVPLIIMLTDRFGPVGAASVWIILNGGQIVFTIPIMHRRLLPQEKWRWYIDDVGVPLGVALLFPGIARLMIPVPTHKLALSAFLLMVSTATLVATALATPVVRDWVQRRLSVWRALHAVDS